MSIASDRSSLYSNTSSLPILRDEDDENNEIVFFGDQPEYSGKSEYTDYDVYHYDDYDILDGDLPSGYTRSELAQQMAFIRSSKDPATGEFLRERKDLLWCLENGCEEVAEGVWSGAWYFTFLYGEKEGRRAWIDARNRRLVKESNGRAQKIDNDAFCSMLKEKARGNRAFRRSQYKSAVDSYLKAEKYLGGAVSGMYLVPHQRAELVKILSNQAECYLRLQKYEDAIVQASAALQLDKRHQKSLLRRAKAVFYGAQRSKSLNSMVAARAGEDLRVIIEMKSAGAEHARRLMDEIGVEVNKYKEPKDQ